MLEKNLCKPNSLSTHKLV